MAFTKKRIDLTFRLGKGDFGKSGFDTLKVSGLRVRANIVNAGSPSMGQANVRVSGLTMDMMNDLSTYSRTSNGSIDVRYNQLTIEAGDDVSGMAQIFQGQIVLAAIDMSGVPDVAFNVIANAGYFEAAKTATPLSYPNFSDVAVIMQKLATDSGYTFENLSSVSVMLSTQYLQGSVREQMMRCANAANINWTIDSGVLAIWPKGSSRGTDIAEVSANTGLIGYPSNIGLGIGVKTLFNPNLQIGKICKVTSSLLYANGKFIMFDMAHDLESEMPGGVWFSQFNATPLNAN